jgi:hypothetical protein
VPLDSIKTPGDFPNGNGINTGCKPSWSDRVKTKVRLGAYVGENKWIASTSPDTNNRIDIFSGTSGEMTFAIRSTKYEFAPYAAGDLYEIDGEMSFML